MYKTFDLLPVVLDLMGHKSHHVRLPCYVPLASSPCTIHYIDGCVILAINWRATEKGIDKVSNKISPSQSSQANPGKQTSH